MLSDHEDIYRHWAEIAGAAGCPHSPPLDPPRGEARSSSPPSQSAIRRPHLPPRLLLLSSPTPKNPLPPSLPSGLDLLRSLLSPDPIRRPSARGALRHSYFNGIEDLLRHPPQLV